MKQFVCILLVCAISMRTFGSPTSCQALFSTNNNDSINNGSIDRILTDEALKSLLVSNSNLVFRKSRGLISWIRNKLTGYEPVAVNFDLSHYNERVAFYLSSLKLFDKSTLKIEDLVPKTFEESLALIEATTQYNSVTEGISDIGRWLIKADAREAKIMAKLFKFKNGEIPAASYSKVARLVLLAHTPPQNITKVLNAELTPKVVQVISSRVTAAFLTESFEDALSQLGFSNSQGFRARAKTFYEKHPNISGYAMNTAWGAIEFSTMGTLLFASPRELYLVQGLIQKLPREEKLKLLNGDYSNIQSNLIGAVKNEARVRFALHTIGFIGFVVMAYFLQEELKHQISTTRSKTDRKKLDAEALAASVNSFRATFDKEPNKAQIEMMKNNIRDSADHKVEIIIDPSKLIN